MTQSDREEIREVVLDMIRNDQAFRDALVRLLTKPHSAAKLANAIDGYLGD